MFCCCVPSEGATLRPWVVCPFQVRSLPILSILPPRTYWVRREFCPLLGHSSPSYFSRFCLALYHCAQSFSIFSCGMELGCSGSTVSLNSLQLSLYLFAFPMLYLLGTKLSWSSMIFYNNNNLDFITPCCFIDYIKIVRQDFNKMFSQTYIWMVFGCQCLQKKVLKSLFPFVI